MKFEKLRTSVFYFYLRNWKLLCLMFSEKLQTFMFCVVGYIYCSINLEKLQNYMGIFYLKNSNFCFCFVGYISHRMFRGCSSDCYLTVGDEDYISSHVVLFVAPALGRRRPPPKLPGQIWIFYNLESPIMFSMDLSSWNNLFNWTVTHRRDSDVHHGYAEYKPFKDKELRNKRMPNISDQSHFNIGWMVSNCKTPSKREEFVKLMKRNSNAKLQFNILGACGKQKCSKSKFQECLRKFMKSNDFYLAFENSLCKDYITEKVMNIYAHNLDIVPVVRGPSEQNNIYLPPNSFINTQELDGVVNVMNTIHSVGSENEHYTSKFHSRQFGEFDINNSKRVWCDLCNRLHSNRVNYTHHRIYHDIDRWWNGPKGRSVCYKPSDIN